METPGKATTASVLRIFAGDLTLAVVIFMCVEALIRMVAPQSLHRTLDDIYEITAEGRYQYKSGVTTVCNNGYGDHEFSINSWRARDRGYGPKKPGEWRILAVGNSYSENQGLAVEDIWANALETQLAETYPERSFSVINAGQAGWGLWNYKDYLHEMLPVIDPDLVVMLFGTTHDLKTSSTPPQPREMTLIAGLPTPRQASTLKRLKFYAWYANQRIEGWSHAYVAFRRLTYYPGLWLGVTKVPRIHPICLDPDAGERLIEPTVEVLRQIKSITDDHGVGLVLINVPHEEEAVPRAARLKVQLERPDVTKLDFARPTRVLEEVAAATPVLMYDPCPDLATEPRSTYFLLFRHWNKLGNSVVAAGLQRYLEQHDLLGDVSVGHSRVPPTGPILGASNPTKEVPCSKRDSYRCWL